MRAKSASPSAGGPVWASFSHRRGVKPGQVRGARAPLRKDQKLSLELSSPSVFIKTMAGISHVQKVRAGLDGK